VKLKTLHENEEKRIVVVAELLAEFLRENDMPINDIVDFGGYALIEINRHKAVEVWENDGMLHVYKRDPVPRYGKFNLVLKVDYHDPNSFQSVLDALNEA